MNQFLLFLVPFLLLPRLVESQCTVCRDGSPVGLPEKELELSGPYAFVESCGALDTLAPALLDMDSLECQVIQDVSTYCGCSIPEEACQLCTEDGSVLQFPDLVVDFPLLPAGILPITCEFVEAYLHSYPQDSDFCLDQTTNLQTVCSCAVQNETQVEPPTGNTEAGASSNSDTTCTLCTDGSDIAWPDKDITDIMKPYLSPEVLDFLPFGENTTLTCGLASTLLEQAIDPKDGLCSEVQSLLPGVCGCPSLAKDPCVFCDDGEDVLQDPYKIVYSLQEYGFPPAQCRDIFLFMTQYEHDSSMCYDARSISYLCGCNDGRRLYFGATTLQQQWGLVWTPRISGIISVLGSLFILWDVWKIYRERNLTIFHQLICCISVWDLFASSAWILSTLPVPKYNEYDEPTGVVGAQGTEATCTFQGFLLQLGFIGVLYQMSLSFYYLLVIRYGWQEFRVQKISKWLHMPLIPGLALAFAGIPKYGNDLWGCYVQPPPFNDDYVDAIIFGILPVAITMVVTSVNMMLVYCKVRQQSLAGNRWRMPSTRTMQASTARGELREQPKRGCSNILPCLTRRGGTAAGPASNLAENSAAAHRATFSRVRRRRGGVVGTLEREVFWQSVLYLSAFYMSWSFMFSSQVVPTDASYRFWVAMLAVTPLQGFFNFLVYVRPRVFAHLRKMKRKRRQRQATYCNATRPFGSAGKKDSKPSSASATGSTPVVSTASEQQSQAPATNVSSVVSNGNADHGSLTGDSRETSSKDLEDASTDPSSSHREDAEATVAENVFLNVHARDQISSGRLEDTTTEEDESGGCRSISKDSLEVSAKEGAPTMLKEEDSCSGDHESTNVRSVARPAKMEP